MKKFSILLLILFIGTLSAKAQLPYSKLINLNQDELKERHFKYDKNKNRYVLRKSYSLINKALNALNAESLQSAEIKPDPDDYVITLQQGEEAPSSLTVRFYKDETFHDIQTWLADNNIDVLETNSGKLIIQKFNYENFSVELDVEKIVVSRTTDNTKKSTISIDESYNIYTYTIYTGIPPYSEWHKKQAAQKAKRDEKGKKKDLDDLM